MPKRPQPSPAASQENARSLVKVKAVRVEAFESKDSDGIDLIVDSGIALYRFTVNPVQALSLCTRIFNFVAGKALNKLMED